MAVFSTVTVPVPEVVLIQRLKAKNSSALMDMFDAYASGVVAVIDDLVHDSALATDLAQQCFMKVWNHASQINEEPGSLEAWIFMIGRDIAIDYLRTREGKSEISRSYKEGELVPSLASSWSGHLADKEVEGLWGAMYQLTAAKKEMLELALYRGMSNSEIATHYTISVGTVKAMMGMALRDLAAIEESGPESSGSSCFFIT